MSLFRRQLVESGQGGEQSSETIVYDLSAWMATERSRVAKLSARTWILL